MSPKARNFFSADEKELIQNSIKNAELDTSGEIRVHIEDECDEDVLDRAAFIFSKLKMDKTEQRNAVLFFVVWVCLDNVLVVVWSCSDEFFLLF